MLGRCLRRGFKRPLPLLGGPRRVVSGGAGSPALLPAATISSRLAHLRRAARIRAAPVNIFIRSALISAACGRRFSLCTRRRGRCRLGLCHSGIDCNLGHDQLADGRGGHLLVLKVDGGRVDGLGGQVGRDVVGHRVEELMVQGLFHGEPFKRLEAEHALQQLYGRAWRRRVDVVQGCGRDGQEGAEVVSHLWQLDPVERGARGADDRKDDVELV
mmetsp:Transcript_8466/g.27851  ORF Transcript_8466/g.27851 Transcript_8466/m.27851 type:complete len:215 (-) Transcript_8466:594-1238(-)